MSKLLFSPLPRFYVREMRTLTCANCGTDQTTVTYLGSFPQFDDRGRPKNNSWDTRPLNGTDSLYSGIEIKLAYKTNSTPICPDCEDSYTFQTPPEVNYAEVLFHHDPEKAKKIIADAEERLTRNYGAGGKTIVRRPAKPAVEKAPKPPADILSMLAAMTKK